MVLKRLKISQEANAVTLISRETHAVSPKVGMKSGTQSVEKSLMQMCIKGGTSLPCLSCLYWLRPALSKLLLQHTVRHRLHLVTHSLQQLHPLLLSFHSQECCVFAVIYV